MASAASYGALLEALRGVSWPARSVARGAATGVHRSRLRGASPEFTEYRPYRQGDDSRRLDWKLLARTDRAYLRITSDRATHATWVVLDASASMAYPPDSRAKWEQACALAAGLLAVAHAGGDPVGLAVSTTRGVRQLPLRTRRGFMTAVVRLLSEVEPVGDAALAPALPLAAPARRRVIISDFLGDADELLRVARKGLGAGGEVFAVHVVAREELEGPNGALLATDPERPDIRRPLVKATRAAYKNAYEQWRVELARAWRAAGAVYTLVVTDEAAEHAVRRIVRPPTAARVGSSR